jgi:hypothetical protein
LIVAVARPPGEWLAAYNAIVLSRGHDQRLTIYVGADDTRDVQARLVTLEEVDVITPSRGAHMRLEDKTKMLRIFIEAVDQWEGEPLHEALVKRLRLLDIAGVTVIRGLIGYGSCFIAPPHSFFHSCR